MNTRRYVTCSFRACSLQLTPSSDLDRLETLEES